MPGKIFYRTRTKIGEGKKAPRFILVAVTGMNMQVYAKHLRMQELEQIAQEVGAKLVELKAEKKAAKMRMKSK